MGKSSTEEQSAASLVLSPGTEDGWGKEWETRILAQFCASCWAWSTIYQVFVASHNSSDG